MEDSVFDDGASSDFAPPAKPAKVTKAAKPKAPAPKKAAGPAKPRARPAKEAGAAPKPKTKAAPKKKPQVDSDDENSDIDMAEGSPDDESLLADTPPKAKKAVGPKKSSGKPLADIANESFGVDGAADGLAPKPKKDLNDASSKYQMVGGFGGSCYENSS